MWKLSLINEAVEKHEELNPKIWDDHERLLPEVKNKILDIVNFFIQQIKQDAVEFKCEDVYLLGSNANYNYNESSDLDVHIIADETFDCANEHLPIIYNAYRSLFNSKYDITIKGINVELYVENKEKLSNVSNGVYSLKKGWLKKPSQMTIPDIDKNLLNKEVSTWESRYYNIITHPDFEDIEQFIDDIYELRINSIAKDGEFGMGNLIFKEIRSLGYLEDLKALQDKVIAKELSLEECTELGYEKTN